MFVIIGKTALELQLQATGKFIRLTDKAVMTNARMARHANGK